MKCPKCDKDDFNFDVMFHGGIVKCLDCNSRIENLVYVFYDEEYYYLAPKK